MNLPTSDQFTEFYRAVHGFDPFPWQERVAARVCGGETATVSSGLMLATAVPPGDAGR